MITVGYWCDECRRKYVRHMCKERKLPCGHDYWASVGVYCQAFARRGERVQLEWGNAESQIEQSVWLCRPEKNRDTLFGRGAYEYWGMRVHRRHDPEPEWYVGEWLASLPDKVVRAFLGRWDSSKDVPDWIAFREHPWAKRACALVRLGGKT